MSRIRADRYTNREGTGAPTFSDGVNVVGVTSMSGDLVVTNGTITGPSQLTISGITSSISDTAVDVFVYDTSKDSDGGAWRKRTQNTSWYNETLNRPTRGSRKEFPAVAVIVIDSTFDLIIYDGDNPDLPMWMKFENSGFLSWSTSTPCEIKTVSMLNGIFVTGGDDGDGGIYVNFVSDHVRTIFGNGNKYDLTGAAPIISNRSVAAGYVNNINGDGIDIVNTIINDVAMTVLPNAPIDSSTGLSIPTIAVATAGGVSVIKDDGTVVDLNVANRPYSSVDFTTDNLIFAVENPGTVNYDLLRYFQIPSANITTASSYGPSSSPALFPTNTKGNIFDSFTYGSPVGLSIIDHADGTSPATSGMIAYLTSNYNTGWMHGDIKGAFLSDTDATNAGIELITNGTFDTDTSGWTAYNSIISVNSNRLKIDDTANAGGWSSAVQEISTEIGKTYYLTFTYTYSFDTFLAGHYAGSYASVGAGTQPTSFGDYGTTSGTYTRMITATTTTTSIVFAVNNNGVSFVDNVTFKEAVQDRSVNNNGLQVFGTITKTAVATGAELVTYSGFSNSNYLQQPYNSDMQTGTGGFSVTAWFNTTSTESEYEGLIYYNRPGSIGEGFQIMMNNSDKGIYFYVYGPTTDVNTIEITGLNDGNWHQIVATHTNGSQQLFIDGVLKDTKGVTTGSINDSEAQLHIGRWYGNANVSDYWWRGSISLVRHSASIPSAEQVKKMYEDEKYLFQENSQATLYGSSDAVTALAYDDTTDLLHVGTSAGRSEFQGLRRINNTTTAVTTALSASNELVAEQ